MQGKAATTMRPDLDDEEGLLAECELDTLRASGPGGQKRNKTESAVRLRHRPSGLIVIASESRSQHDNRSVALQRMRMVLALRLRQPAPEDVPAAIATAIDTKGKLRLGQKDRRYAGAVAAALDVLEAHAGRVSDAAKQLGISTGNLSAFLTGDDAVYVETNLIRTRHGLGPLKKRE